MDPSLNGLKIAVGKILELSHFSPGFIFEFRLYWSYFGAYLEEISLHYLYTSSTANWLAKDNSSWMPKYFFDWE